MHAIRGEKIHDASQCTIHHLEADDQKVRGGPGQGGSFGAFRSPAIKHFYVLSGRLISRLAGNFRRTRISRWFTSNRRFDQEDVGHRGRVKVKFS